MSVSSPPPSSAPTPPTSSSAPFIVAAVAMLAAIGGLLFWKLSHRPAVVAPSAAIASAPSAAAPAPVPTLEELPPPPPPPPASAEEANTTQAPPKAGSGKSAPTAGATGCSGECTGTGAPGFESQLQGAARLAYGCYQRVLQSKEQLQGRMLVNLRVGPNGQVCSASLASDELKDQALSSCVLQKFRGAQFGPPKNGCVEARVPLNFVAKK